MGYIALSRLAEQSKVAGSLKVTKSIVLRMWHAALKRHGAAKMASMGGDKTIIVSQIENESMQFKWG